MSGCSEHLRLRFRTFRVCGYWICSLCNNWDMSYSFSELPQFSVPLALSAPASRFQESQSKNRTSLFLSFLLRTHWGELGDLRCTATGTSMTLSLCCTRAPSTVFKLGDVRTYLLRCTCGTRTVGVNFCMFTEICRQLCR